MLADFIIESLTPNYEAIKCTLSNLKLTPKEVARVVEESYPVESFVQGARETAKATLNLLKRNDVLADSQTRETFEKFGLIA